MKSTARILFAVIAFVSAGALFADASGKELYSKKSCGACHGSKGQGTGAAPAITNTTKTKEQIISIIKNGSKTKRVMSPIKGTDAEIEAIADYVLTLK